MNIARQKPSEWPTTQHSNVFQCQTPEAMAYVGEMNSADGGDDDEADDEGGDGHN